MITISPIKFIIPQTKKTKKVFSYSNALNRAEHDVFVRSTPISFGSSQKLKKPSWMSEQQFSEISEKLSRNDRKSDSYYQDFTCFSEDEKDKIINTLTRKNVSYLEPLLQMNRRGIDACDIVDMLNYIDKTDESKESIDKKFSFMKNFEENIINLLGENLYQGDKNSSDKKEQKSFFDFVQSSTFPILLKTDVLNVSDPSSNLKTTSKKIAKHIASMRDWSNEDNEKKADIIRKQRFSAQYLGEILLASTMMSSYVFDDFVYNRMGNNAFNRYAQKLDKLEQNDINLMRLISKYAKSIDENDKDGKPNPTSIIRLFDIIDANRALVNMGYDDAYLDDEKLRIHEKEGDQNFFINDAEMEHRLLLPILMSNGVPEETAQKYKQKYDIALAKAHQKGQAKVDNSIFWDMDYIHLLRSDGNKALRKMIVDITKIVANAEDIDNLDMKQEFMKYISSKGSDYYHDFYRNKEIFTSLGIDYDKWLTPNIDPIVCTFEKKPENPDKRKKSKMEKMAIVEKEQDNGGKRKIKTYTAKLWRRIPQESILDGNYTTCCTALDKDQGNSFPEYIGNTFANIIEVRNERGEVRGMSRLFIAQIGGETSLLIDNIEVNNTSKNRYLYSQENIENFRNMIFKYAIEFSKHIRLKNDDGTYKEKPLKVYFTTNYTKVNGITNGLEKIESQKEVRIIGHPTRYYINTYGGERNGMECDDEFYTRKLVDITNFFSK